VRVSARQLIIERSLAMPPALLFVYGSLMRAGRHHAELAGARFLGEARTASGYRRVRLGAYRALELTPKADPAPKAETEAEAVPGVAGELFEVDAPRLRALDAFEGNEYERSEVRLEQAVSGGFAVALAYLKKAS